MNKRIQKIIRAKNIKKVEFARQLKLSAPYISELCSGKTHPSDRTIADICKTFNVNETWLRTGEGEMFVQKKPQPLDELLSDLLGGEAVTDEDRVLVKNFLELPDDSRKAVIEFVQKCAKELSAPVEPDTTSQERTVVDAGGQKRTELDRIAAEIEAGQQEMEAGEDNALDTPKLDKNGLTPEEAEEWERNRQEIIAKRGRTGQQSVLPNANAS